MNIERVFLIVLDSFGIGYLPDAADYGDLGANTLKSVYTSKFLALPNLAKLGLYNIEGVDVVKKVINPTAAYGRCSEKSKGKDTTIGHLEIAGIISPKPFPTYPNGFPKKVIDEFEAKTGVGTICNLPYSGTEVIEKYGEEHLKAGKLIVYTSADSVFQVAAHEEYFGLKRLYEVCATARDMLNGEHGVGRVIARPFAGEVGNFYRTTNRHDYALAPPRPTMLDILKDNKFDVISVGKINDIFAGSGITQAVASTGNADGMNKTKEIASTKFRGLCFTNLVDFDMLYGHRNDIDGYAKALSEFDLWLNDFLPCIGENDLLIITADHGCDPGFSGTDHTREYIPVLLYGGKNINLGTRTSFADIGQTVIEVFGIDAKLDGHGFYSDIKKD